MLIQRRGRGLESKVLRGKFNARTVARLPDHHLRQQLSPSTTSVPCYGHIPRGQQTKHWSTSCTRAHSTLFVSHLGLRLAANQISPQTSSLHVNVCTRAPCSRCSSRPFFVWCECLDNKTFSIAVRCNSSARCCSWPCATQGHEKKQSWASSKAFNHELDGLNWPNDGPAARKLHPSM